MSSLRVEYLAILDVDGEFCADVASLNHVLQADRRLVLKGAFIHFENCQFDYEVREGKTENLLQRYFHVAIGCGDLLIQDKFEVLLRSIRGILYKISNKEPQVLWDEVGRHYAISSYPIIYDIENLMRKLITRFMLTKIGLGWIKDAIPKEVVDSVKTKAPTSNYLHHVDFIQLSNFLFKPYTTGDTKTLLEKIGRAENTNDLNINELKELIPSSNWERYFAPLVKCDSEFLRNRWERLYELRNHIAHNRSVSKAEHDEIIALVSDVRPKIEEALSSVGEIKISEDEREIVAESVAIGRHALNGEYIEYWKKAHLRLLNFAIAASGPENQERAQRLGNSVSSILNILYDEGLISRAWRQRIRESFRLRNVIVHHSDVIFPESRLKEEIDFLKGIILMLDIRIEKGHDTKDVLPEIEPLFLEFPDEDSPTNDPKEK